MLEEYQKHRKSQLFVYNNFSISESFFLTNHLKGLSPVFMFTCLSNICCLTKPLKAGPQERSLESSEVFVKIINEWSCVVWKSQFFVHNFSFWIFFNFRKKTLDRIWKVSSNSKRGKETVEKKRKRLNSVVTFCKPYFQKIWKFYSDYMSRGSSVSECSMICQPVRGHFVPRHIVPGHILPKFANSRQ